MADITKIVLPNGDEYDLKDATSRELLDTKYVKPSGGIPKTDLASDVQTSLGKADTALQTAPVTSVNGQTGAVTVQPTLVSGTNIKTINGQSVLGSGDLEVGSSIEPATSTPVMDGDGAIGTSDKYARADHQHPSDSNKVNTSDYNPAVKTAAMTQLVGKDDSGRLWTAPGSGGSGVDIGLGVADAEVGDIITVASVDENGVPTAWEKARNPSEVLIARAVVSGKTANVVSFDYENNTVTLDKTGMATTGGIYNNGGFVLPRTDTVWNRFDICPAALRGVKIQLRVTDDPYTYYLTTDGTTAIDIADDSAVDVSKLMIKIQTGNASITNIPANRKLRAHSHIQVGADNSAIIFGDNNNVVYGCFNSNNSWRPMTMFPNVNNVVINDGLSVYELITLRNAHTSYALIPYADFDVIITPTNDRIFYRFTIDYVYMDARGNIFPQIIQGKCCTLNNGISRITASCGNYMVGVDGDYIELFDLGEA